MSFFSSVTKAFYLPNISIAIASITLPRQSEMHTSDLKIPTLFFLTRWTTGDVR